MSQTNQFELEQTEALKILLNGRFFDVWKNADAYNENELDKEYSLWKDSGLELFITSECNQKCEYCYLAKRPELYPAEFLNKETILHNLELVYN